MPTSVWRLSTTNSESRRWEFGLWFVPLLTTSCLFTNLLRSSSSPLQLSPAIVGGLHNIARSIETRCYTEGLNIHTHIVSNSNFSETSAFMPVLKVVLTQASKLGVWAILRLQNPEALLGAVISSRLAISLWTASNRMTNASKFLTCQPCFCFSI